MLKCCILDDEPLAIKLLSGYVAKTPLLELTLATTDPFKALATVQSGEVDLILLDIQMPELTGIQFMKIIDNKCGVILTTAYKDYALQGFEFDVIDYLLKPISFEKFHAAIQKATQRLNTQLPPKEYNHYLFVKSEHRLIKVNFDEIFYFESFRDYITIHTTSDKIMTLQSLRSFEETLPSDKFLRIHKSHLIAIDKISAIENNRILINNTFLPIGEVYRDHVFTKLQLKK
ncbi:MAG: LytTR family DNA-binding domain-containing protein [Chitinophagales bacterium]|jgi:two-component system LytT family response regulator|nr:response regulator transcription factor [Bacteroidota bacterium]MBP9878739.1 response regulator transcription factor [Chitinophagales bacterium]